MFSNPDNLLSRINTASELLEQGQLPEALILLNKILEQTPNSDAALTLRGIVHGRMGDTESALADLSQAVELDPHNEMALLNYAVAHVRSGKASDGLAILSRALQLRPDNERAIALRDRVARNLGLEELDSVAKAMEQFAYAQCGPGLEWKVELKEMYFFQPKLPQEKYNVAIFDLCQDPQAFIQVMVAPTEYTVKISVEKQVPRVDRLCLADIASHTIPAEIDALLGLLNGFIDKGILTKVGSRLCYRGN